MDNTISNNWRAVRERVDAAAVRAGRDPHLVTVVAVTKTHPVQAAAEVVAAGAADIGENKIQEAVGKFESLREMLGLTQPMPRRHLIGHLQSNKAKLAAQNFDLVHSVDSVKLARDLGRHSMADGGRTLDVLIQVNVSGEDSKSGVEPRELIELVPGILKDARGVRICGLMTMAPEVDDPEEVRVFVRQLRLIGEAVWEAHPELADACEGAGPALSMGMTGDFEVAVEEGATLVRVGSAIFGAREYQTPDL